MGDSKFVIWQSLLDEISSKAPQHLLSEISKAPSLKAKIEICYNNPHIHSALKNWLSCCISKPLGQKSADFSSRYRENGNVYCRKKNLMSALKFYNKALFYAPKNSEEEKSAYGNRSHVLLQISHFEESIIDIDRSLDKDGHSPRNINLLLRKCQAFIALSNYSEARNILDELMSVRSSLPPQLQAKILQSLEAINKIETSNHKNTYKETSQPNKSLDYPDIIFHENPNFRYASKSISLKDSQAKGRYVIANNNIAIGDVLFAERPFSFVILPNMIDKYCSFCCKRIIAPVPCEYCALACFCDETCRSSALSSFHSWECGGLEVCYSIGIVHLSLRVALQGLLEENTDKYKEIRNLVAHLNDLQSTDLFSYSVTATLLIIYLENYTRLFKGEDTKNKLYEFGGTILLHIGQLVCNGHAITDMETMESGSDTSLLIEDQVRVATAIYPSASMMNHSCKPNIINSFFNTLLVVRATENLKAGDEVYNCYGPMVHNTEFSKRQELLLSQYFFICDCNACSKYDGPISDKFLCKGCSNQLTLQTNTCDNCSCLIDTGKLLKDLNESDIVFKEGLNKFEAGQFPESIDSLSKALKLREMHCHTKHKKLLECRDSLAKSYAMQGREEDAFIYLEQNLCAIEHIYGKISIELGQEIMKLLSVATSLRDKNEKLSTNQRNILAKSIEYGKKGLLIFKLSYGDWHPRFREMKKHLNYIQTFKSEIVGENRS